VVFLILSYSLLLAAIAHDLVAYKRVHPVYIWVVGLFVAYDVINPLAFQSAAWLRVARWLVGEAAV